MRRLGEVLTAEEAWEFLYNSRNRRVLLYRDTPGFHGARLECYSDAVMATSPHWNAKPAYVLWEGRAEFLRHNAGRSFVVTRDESPSPTESTKGK